MPDPYEGHRMLVHFLVSEANRNDEGRLEVPDAPRTEIEVNGAMGRWAALTPLTRCSWCDGYAVATFYLFNQMYRACSGCFQYRLVGCRVCSALLFSSSGYNRDANGWVTDVPWFDTGNTLCGGCRATHWMCNTCAMPVPEDTPSYYVRYYGQEVECCRDCRENADICTSCDSFFIDSCECENSYGPPTLSSTASIELSTMPGEEIRRFPTFGIEFEMEFEEDDRPPCGGYHSYEPAQRPFYGGWRAEDDGSLSYGVELISPVLHGPAGIAEALATQALLHKHGAIVKRTCGQHIHLGLPESRQAQDEFGWRVQVIGATLEEMLFCTTGSWARASNEYAPYVKDYDLPGWIRANNDRNYRTIGDGRCVVHVGRATVEFRYPPGTLNPEQVVLNLGLCNMMYRMAQEYDAPTLRGMAIGAAMNNERYREARRNDHYSDGTETRVLRWNYVAESIIAGASLLAKEGFTTEGPWKDLPYNTLEPPVAVVKDSFGDVVEVNLPSHGALMDRFKRQTGRFLIRAAKQCGVSTSEAERVARTVHKTVTVVTEDREVALV